jgi:hypothetical protein
LCSGGCVAPAPWPGRALLLKAAPAALSSLLKNAVLTRALYDSLCLPDWNQWQRRATELFASIVDKRDFLYDNLRINHSYHKLEKEYQLCNYYIYTEKVSMIPDGFSQVKKCLLRCLNEGKFQHELRTNIDVKNLLATGEVSKDEVISLIKSSIGDFHSKSPHHIESSFIVHVIRNKGWYIKFYFLEVDANENLSVFISVHT